MKLELQQKKTLLALRAGPLSREQLAERFGRDHKGASLVKLGLARMRDEITFEITALGRENCPSRRIGIYAQKGRPKSNKERNEHATNP
ncbi:hypothetical protein [Methylophilus sp. DW102]|uniref:hypothetical protein n=1 Tax=Methylophilus sp. DW102 TaxID=3095607 RepID=UPI00308A914C|nr:hypothetical protein MTDW_26330 [Methylophilus sp. DW102]